MRKYLWILVFMCFVLGSFCIGNGFTLYLKEQQEPEKDYWLGSGRLSEELLNPVQRDEWNYSLINNREYMTMENELHTDTDNYICEARISNAPESNLRCTVTLIRNSTGEILYQSKLLEPGYYIEYIQLLSNIKEGYYPSTIVWSFYELEGDSIIGEMAENAVVVVSDSKRGSYGN